MNILITGATGFIGSNLINELIENNTIICIDNNFTGKMNNIEKYLNFPNFKFINYDIINPINVDFNLKLDQIYHLACPASPEKYQIDPIFTSKTCFIGTLNVLELARKHNATILLASTSECYGEPLVTPQYEEYRGNVNTIGIRSCYDEGKRIAETLFMDYNRKYNLNTRIARIFNTYGPNMDLNDGRVITNFIKQALENKDITVYGDGMQTRSFCYIDDQVKGLVKLMNSNYIYPVNIGNPDEYTINEISDIILKKTNSKSKVIYLNLPEDDPTNRNPDISKAKKILDWEPKINILEGIDIMINYIKSKYNF